ncbi:hypothetical protein CRUP_023761 [Coryphaenoides rupestris]|nr:hypothetical protein CRUP_023761 [Coryphaenoides rupestris]
MIHSVETVNDGHFHTVELMTFDRMVNLTVDGGEPTTLNSLGSGPRTREGPLYVGGMPDEGAPRPSAPSRPPQLLNGSSFQGCIRNLYINQELQDFTQGRMRPGVGPECHCRPGWAGQHCDQPIAGGVGVAAVTSSTETGPCQDNKCVRGVCVPLGGQTYRCDPQEAETPSEVGGGGGGGAMGGGGGGGGGIGRGAAGRGWCQGLLCHRGQCQQSEDGVHCVCDPGFTGELCDVESSCHGEAVRYFPPAAARRVSLPDRQALLWVECRGAVRADAAGSPQTPDQRGDGCGAGG